MSDFTRRSLIISGVAAAAACILAPAEAATESIAVKIVSAGFIIGISSGSGVLTFQGRRYPLPVGGVSAGAEIGASGADLIGTASHLHDVRDIVAFTLLWALAFRLREVGRPAVERAGRRAAAQGPRHRVQVFS